jgi:hypothetical protein
MIGGCGRIAPRTYHRGHRERQTHRRDAEGAEKTAEIESSHGAAEPGETRGYIL